MKQKHPERVDRRRNLVEMNLISERTKAGSTGSRRGCIKPFAVLMVVAGSALAAWLGLR
jgi:hypothetical protein